MEPLENKKIEKAFEDFSKKFITHEKGFFILAPSGTGKTYFVTHQKEPHWLDGDKLWTAAGAHPNRSWWLEGLKIIQEVDKRSDEVTEKAKKRGFRILGASNDYLKPDAIVIPDWEEHKKLIKLREETNYDGGATSDRLEQVLSHRNEILKWKAQGVPVFETVQKAAEYLEQTI